jgi:AP-3 complex subunit beta
VQEDIVKLQAMTLAVKLCLTNPKQTRLLAQYVLTLARYDQNYDLRDRARFLRHLVFPGGEGGTGTTAPRLAKHARKIFLATKPAPQADAFFSGNLCHRTFYAYTIQL